MPVDINDSLYRRSYGPPGAIKFVNPDGTPTSRSFKLRQQDEGRLSVDIKSLTTHEKSIVDASKYMLFEIKVESVLRLNLIAEADPIENNPAHACILGMDIEDDIMPKLLAINSIRVLI